MKVRVFHVCKERAGKRARPGGDAEIVIDIEMPFVPFPGLFFKPTPKSDYLKVAYVYWSVEKPDYCEAHTDGADPLYPFSTLTMEGWRRA